MPRYSDEMEDASDFILEDLIERRRRRNWMQTDPQMFMDEYESEEREQIEQRNREKNRRAWRDNSATVRS